MHSSPLGALSVAVVLAFGCTVRQAAPPATAQIVATAAPAQQQSPPAPEPAPEAAIHGDHIEIQHQILFDFDSDHIREGDSQAVLHDLIALFQAHAEVRRVRIDGHTDAQGSARHNQDLSARRAAAVARYLNEHGVTAQFETAGHGSTNAVCQDSTEECHQRNRRVEFTILPGGQ